MSRGRNPALIKSRIFSHAPRHAEMDKEIRTAPCPTNKAKRADRLRHRRHGVAVNCAPRRPPREGMLLERLEIGRRRILDDELLADRLEHVFAP